MSLNTGIAIQTHTLPDTLPPTSPLHTPQTWLNSFFSRTTAVASLTFEIMVPYKRARYRYPWWRHFKTDDYRLYIGPNTLKNNEKHTYTHEITSITTTIMPYQNHLKWRNNTLSKQGWQKRNIYYHTHTQAHHRHIGSVLNIIIF